MAQKSGFMSSKISDILSDSTTKEKGTHNKTRQYTRERRLPSLHNELKKMWQEVQELAASQLERPQRRRRKEQQLEALGAKITRKENRQMSYPMLMGIRRKQHEKEKRRIEEARAAGIVLPLNQQQTTKRRTKRKKTNDVHSYINKLRGDRHGREPTHIDAPEVGTYHNGTLVISQEEIRRVTRKRRREEGSSSRSQKRRRHTR